MKSNDYHFLNQWEIPHPIQRVWIGITESIKYPEWWGVVYEKVEKLNDRRGDQVGAIASVVAHGRLPYTIRFVAEIMQVNAPYELALKAEGDLDGTGRWTLEENSKGTDVTFEWIVRADKPILKVLSPILKPLFQWNHYWTMNQGEKALIQYLKNDSVQ